MHQNEFFGGKKACLFVALIDLLRITLLPWTVLRNLSEIFNDLVFIQEAGEKSKQFPFIIQCYLGPARDGGDQGQLSLLRFVSRELTKDGETRQEGRDL